MLCLPFSVSAEFAHLDRISHIAAEVSADSMCVLVTPLKECNQLHLPRARYPSARIEKDMAVIHKRSLGAAEWSC